MKKLVKLIIVLVLVMVSGCTTQKKEENARVIDTSMFLYKVSNQEGKYSYLFGTCHPGRYPIKSLDKVTEKALDESDSIYLECDMNPSPQKIEEYAKYNTYNSIRDLGLEDKYENLMKQYKSLKGKPGYALYNVFVINSLINSDPEVLNKANISKFSAIDNYIYDYAQKKKNFLIDHQAQGEKYNSDNSKILDNFSESIGKDFVMYFEIFSIICVPVYL